jgi:Domain of Unknown Function (DUF1521)
MINGVGALPNMRMALDPVEDLAINSTAYAKPLVSGESGGFKITSQAEGRVVFDLDDGYSLAVDESRSAVTVANAGKETVQIWGEAQMALDGKTLGHFAGTTSLVLGNGTKITMETLSEAKSADIYYLDRLTVTQGERAVVVSGVSQVMGGDLTVKQSQLGHFVDSNTRDGLVFKQVAKAALSTSTPQPPVIIAISTSSPEPMVVTSPQSPVEVVAPALAVSSSSTPISVAEPALPSVIVQPTSPEPPSPVVNTLTGWADEYGIAVTPEMLRATLPGGAFGPNSDLLSLGEFRALIMRFLSWGQISSLFSWSTQAVQSDARRQDPSDVARSSEIRRAWARHADELAAATRSAIRNSERRGLELNR